MTVPIRKMCFNDCIRWDGCQRGKLDCDGDEFDDVSRSDFSNDSDVSESDNEGIILSHHEVTPVKRYVLEATIVSLIIFEKTK
ncbi:hypothetical protein QE152_g8849 [Popillia japonica]|uniref:Uncharacterized protein n=1 Tax=Popillia japonica TaxID=7064 RepID=A0AAW1M1F6_POPJA